MPPPPPDALPTARFANPRRLLREALPAILPPRQIRTSEWAEQHRWVPSPSGGRLVKWSNATAPYLVGPMDALDDERFDTVAFVGPAACGKTMVPENWLLKTLEADPADFLWYANTQPIIESYVKGRIEPMLTHHDKLIGHLAHGRHSVDLKRFRAMTAAFLHYGPSTVINKHVARLVADEVDAYDPTAGDPEDVLKKRLGAAQSLSGDAKLYLSSHPDLATGPDPERHWQRGIMAAYRTSTRATGWWACPDCEGWASPNPRATHRMTLEWDDAWEPARIEDEARLVCPHCSAHHDEHARRTMLQTHRWLCEGQEIAADGSVTGDAPRARTAGFWLTGIENAFLPNGIGGLAKERARAERNARDTGDDRTLKQVLVKGWGLPHQPPKELGNLDAATIAERARPDLRPGECPPWIRVVLVAVDTQANRFELLARGYGPEGSLILHREAVSGNPATSEDDWDDLIRHIASLRFPLADDPTRAIRPRAATIDAMGEAGVTENAFRAWRRARRRGLAPRLGRIRGQDAWGLLLSRGVGTRGAPDHRVSYPDARKDRKHSTAARDVPLLLFNASSAKDRLNAQLLQAEGKNAIHIPRDAAMFPPEWFEQLAAESRDAQGRWTKRAQHLRNEAWDLLAMADALGRTLDLQRLDWDRPPGWAAPHDSNTLVGPLLAADEAETARRPPTPARTAQATAEAVRLPAAPAVAPPPPALAAAALTRRPGPASAAARFAAAFR